MTYDYKSKRTVVLLSSGIELATAMSVLSHLAMAIGAHAAPDIMGRAQLRDASGCSHMGISKYAIIIKKAEAPEIRQALESARSVPGLMLADFPEEMLRTGHDDELAAAMAQQPETALGYLGAIFYGTTDKVDWICRKYSLWR